MEDNPQDAQSRPRPSVPPDTPPKRLSGMTWLLIILVLLLVLPSLAEQVAERVQFAVTRADQRAKAEVARGELANMPDATSRFAWVAKGIEPCVVGIETTRVVGVAWDERSYLYPEAQSGAGSGVIVDEEGYLVTNYHVIDGAERVTVKLADGRTIPEVKVIGADPLADLAVLKIEAGGLMAAPWGDSRQLEVGDEVLAVGNPYRLARTVTAGIISAKGRPGVVGNLSHQEFLQTDAAVNPGNSGGPLVNMKGEVVGINTAIYGDTYRGISFAIPSEVAQAICERLKATGKVMPRGWLGVKMYQVTEWAAMELGLEDTRGALVYLVYPNSPGEKAGIRQHDVIVGWNGTPISNPTELSLAVVQTDINSEATVELFRKGRKLELTVIVGERPTTVQQ